MSQLAGAPITFIIILVNVLVSGYALYMAPGLLDRLSFKPREILKEREYHRLFTAGFVHVNLGHLLFNMFTLFFFGPLLESLLGPVKYVVLYFGSELAAHALALVLHRDDPVYAAVGASGAISGVLFAFCLFFPFETIYLFAAVPVWAIVFAVGYVIISAVAIRGRGEAQVGGVAHEAHLGGAIGGLVLTIVLEPRSVSIFLSHFT